MIYGKAKIEGESLVLTEQQEMDQVSLLNDCWAIQFEGLRACETCEFRKTEDCGGGATLKRLRS